jgi:hypothetical protein
MRRMWKSGLVVTAGLLGTGCGTTARPMLFHRNNPEMEPCPGPVEMPCTEGPMLGEMPMTGPPAMAPGGMPPGGMPPGGMPPGAITIPGPGIPVPAAPPAVSPPVGPQPRTVPANPTNRPTT